MNLRHLVLMIMVGVFSLSYAGGNKEAIMEKCYPSIKQSSVLLTKKQKKECVQRLIKRLEDRPWEFGESGENIKEIIKEVTGITLEETQKAEVLIEEIFFAAVEQIKKLDDLTDKERSLFDFYNQYLQAFRKGEKVSLDEAEKKLGIKFTKENRVRVTQKFMLRAVSMPILTKSERQVWEFIVDKAKTTGKPPALSDVVNSTGISVNEVRDALDVLRKMGFLKGDVGKDTIAFPFSIAGSIDAEAKGYITTVTLKDGRSMKVPCAIDGLGAGFSVGAKDWIVEAKDPYSQEEVRVEVKGGQIYSYEPDGIFVFAGLTCANINFFASEENLKNWRAVHPDVEGEIMTLQRAFEYGKKVLGQHDH